MYAKSLVRVKEQHGVDLRPVVLMAALALALVVGVAQAEEKAEGAHQHEGAEHGLSKAIAVLTPKNGSSVSGTVTFTQTAEGVRIVAHVSGLTPGKHGFHIHEYGDISSADGKSAGGHFNPDGHDHSNPGAEKRHVGDLGNLVANAEGHAMYDRVDKAVQLHGAQAILSRAVVVHAGEDDLTSQPTGAAGGRVAVGVIGLAKSE